MSPAALCSTILVQCSPGSSAVVSPIATSSRTFTRKLSWPFSRRATLTNRGGLEPWLFAIARNVAADYARCYWRRSNIEQLTEVLPEVSAAEEPRSDPNLADAMARLPDQQREAFSMLKIEGLTIEDAAQGAGVTEGALRVRAHRAYKALRRLISE